MADMKIEDRLRNFVVVENEVESIVDGNPKTYRLNTAYDTHEIAQVIMDAATVIVIERWRSEKKTSRNEVSCDYKAENDRIGKQLLQMTLHNTELNKELEESAKLLEEERAKSQRKQDQIDVLKSRADILDAEARTYKYCFDRLIMNRNPASNPD